MSRLTRRQAIGAGTAGILAAGGVHYGRFSLGTEFEEHVSSVLGLDLAYAKALLAQAREILGDAEYDFRATAFLGATTFPGNLVPVKRVRRKAIEGLMGKMFLGPPDLLLYLGERSARPDGRCRGLLTG